MSKAGELFEEKYATWTPTQAKSFFRAGMVDDFFVSNIQGEWVVTLHIVGREGLEQFVTLRGAREADKHKPRHFKTLDAAVRAAKEIGFDTRIIGPSRVGYKSLERGLSTVTQQLRELRQGRTKSGGAKPLRP